VALICRQIIRKNLFDGVLGLPTNEFINSSAKAEAKKRVADILAEKFNPSTVIVRHHAELYVLLALAPFYEFDTDTKQRLKGKITWLSNRIWNEFENLFNKAMKGPTDYTKAIKRFLVIMDLKVKFSANYICTNKAYLKWPW
jgi:hypothetical protein